MKRVVTLFFLVTLLGLTGCRCPAPRLDPASYPLGIYGVSSTNDLAMVKAAGFNLVTGPASHDYLDAARAHQLKVLASPNTSAGPDFDPARARQAIRQFDAHPALWAWYLIDEPDFNLIAPDQVKSAQRQLKSLHPSKPTALTLFQGYEAQHYANITDITMIDRYPIPWLPLANFGQHVQMARLALPPEKPLVAILQAFDWTYCSEMLHGESNLRAPTGAEIRCMTYEALARGANGLFYFAYDGGRWKMREHPETWTALTQVVAEVNERLPLFQARHGWWPKDHVFADREHRFNAALESSITSRLLRVNKGHAAVPAGDYILAVNNTDRQHTYSFTLPPVKDQSKEDRGPKPESRGQKSEVGGVSGIRQPASGLPPSDSRLPVLGEGRSLQPAKNWVTDEFGPYAVHIYGPLN